MALSARVAPHKPQDAEDAKLVERLCCGDEVALAEVMGKYGYPLLRFIERMVNDTYLAEEIYQDTMLKLWQHAPAMYADGHLRAWLFRVARNKTVDVLRKCRLECESLSDTIPATCGDPDVLAEKNWVYSQLHAAVAQLSIDYSRVIQMRFYEQLTLREIAVALSIPAGTVKSRYHYAVRRLAKLLARMGMDEVPYTVVGDRRRTHYRA